MPAESYVAVAAVIVVFTSLAGALAWATWYTRGIVAPGAIKRF